MKLKKNHITAQPFLFKFQISELEQDQLTIDTTGKIALACDGKIHKLNEDKFLLQGNYSTSFATDCHYCSINFMFEAHQNFQLLLLPQTMLRQQIVTNADNKLDVDYYETEEINLAHYFQRQFLLELPFSIKCQKNCQGVCFQCGSDLNQATCDCQKSTVYRPFAEYFKRQ